MEPCIQQPQPSVFDRLAHAVSMLLLSTTFSTNGHVQAAFFHSSKTPVGSSFWMSRQMARRRACRISLPLTHVKDSPGIHSSAGGSSTAKTMVLQSVSWLGAWKMLSRSLCA